MFRYLRPAAFQCQWPMRNYVTTKEFRKRMTVLKQDTENIPTYNIPRSKQTDRRLYVWGFAATGALGVHQNLSKLKHKNAHIVHHPTRQPFAERVDVLDVACGYGFTLFATKPDGNGITLFGTGLNTDSQIGYHKLGGKLHTPMEIMVYPAPIALPRESTDKQIHCVTSVTAGRAHMAVLTDTGMVFTRGNNSFGQCGRAIVDDEQYEQSQVMHRLDKSAFDGHEVKAVVCGTDHTLFLMTSGQVYACGWGADGQTGVGNYNSTDTPTLVAGDILNEKIVKIASTVDCVLAINENGEVFGWGNSEYGQLASGSDHQQINTPQHISMTKESGKVIDIAAGGSYCLILNENGDVFTWGYGLLGLGPNVEYTKTPTQIPATLFGRNEFNPSATVTSIYSGVSHMAAISDKHDLFLWGKNRFGCLGLGHEKDQYFPLKVAVGGNVLKASCGPDHTVAFCKAFI